MIIEEISLTSREDDWDEVTSVDMVVFAKGGVVMSAVGGISVVVAGVGSSSTRRRTPPGRLARVIVC